MVMIEVLHNPLVIGHGLDDERPTVLIAEARTSSPTR